MKEQQVKHQKDRSYQTIAYLLLFMFFHLYLSLIQAAPGDILYENDFATSGDVTGEWTRIGGSGGNDFQASTNTFNSSPSSLRIRDESGGSSNSGLIDASSAGSVDVSFWLQNGAPWNAPESGEDLEFYYINSSGSWILLATYDGADAAGTQYTESFTLPSNALHNNLRFRFIMTAGGNNDRWYVDDFTVTETGQQSQPLPTIDYHFDQCSYDGSSGEAIDSGSSGNHATSQANADTDPDDAILCQSALFSGNGDYLVTSQELSDLRGTSSLSFWIKTTQTGENTAWRAPGIAGIEQNGGTDDIFWGWLDASGRIGLSVGNNNSTKSSTSINNGSWHHIVLTRNASTGAYAIYIDRNLDASGTSSTGTIGNTFSSIGRTENTNGSPNYFIGRLDELKIYDQALSLTQIQEIYDNESSGDNYDGTSRNCPTCNTGEGSCAAYFPDTIQGHHTNSYVTFNDTGQVISDPDNILTVPSIIDNTSGGGMGMGGMGMGMGGGDTHDTCNTTDCTATGTIVDALTLPTFVTTSTTTDLTYTSGTVTISNTEIDRLDVYGSANVTFSASSSTYVIDEAWFGGNSTVTFNPGTYWINTLGGFGWAGIYENANIIINGPVTIYVNGQLDHLDIEGNATINTGGSAEDLAIVSYTQVYMKDDTHVKAVLYGIGSEIVLQNNAHLTGAISASDEIEIQDSGYVTYEDVSDVQVGDLCGGTPPLTLDHIEISHDGNALTCSDETLTIRACTNADCTSVSTSDTVVTLSATGGTSSWSSNPVTIPADSSSGVDITLTHRTAETITVSASSVPAASNGLICSPVGCNITFSEAGYLLSLPNHNSCSTASLSIQAVRLSDTGTSCAPAYTGNQSVNFSFNYLNPATGSILPVLDSSNMAAATVVQNRTVNFDGTASATLDFEYQDAGQLSVTVADGGSNGLTAATVNTIVTPAKLNIYTTDTNNACTGPDYGNCTAFKVAGIPGNAASEFNLIVEGACADDTVTPNFQLNNILLSSNLVAPTLASGATANGANGTLGVTTVNITSGGTATVTETLSEVGAFSITATPPNYLGQSIPAATSSTIGRFIPDRFIVTDNSPLFNDATCNFTYQDQSFGFASGLTPELTVTAVNSNGATTANYGGDGVSNNDFWKLDASVLSGRTYSNQVTAFPGSLSSTLGSITVTDETDYDGINTFTFPLDTLTYNKADVVPDPTGGPTSDAPFGANATLNLTAALLTDDDGVNYDQDNNGSADAFVSSNITGTNIRWGRWFIANAFGSELQALPMVAEAQYYDGTNFVINTDDTSSSCSTFTSVTTTLSNYSGNLSSGETTLPSPIADIVDGLVTLTLSAPGGGNDGSLLMTLTSPAWMLYDYDGDSTAENASGTATFGIFEGRQPVIIQRQSY